MAFPWGIPGEHNVLVADDAEQDGPGAQSSGEPAESGASAARDSPPSAPRPKIWRPWTVALSALVALLFSLLLLVADGLAGVLNNLGGPQSVYTHVRVAAIGHGVLAVTSAVLLFIGLSKPNRSRPAALAAWTIIPVGIGWFFLSGRIAAA